MLQEYSAACASAGLSYSIQELRDDIAFMSLQRYAL